MAEIDILSMPVAPGLGGLEAVPIVQGGTNKRTTIQGIASLFSIPPIRIVTVGFTVSVQPTDGAIVLALGVGGPTTLLLPSVASRLGQPLLISDFGGNAGDITVVPDGTETIMGAATADLGSGGPGVGAAAAIALYPSVALNGWFQA